MIEAAALASAFLGRWDDFIVIGGLLIFSDWPRERIALAAAGFLLINRRIASTDVLNHVDGDLLLLLMGLLVVNAALPETHVPQRLLADLRATGVELHHPLPLFLVIRRIGLHGRRRRRDCLPGRMKPQQVAADAHFGRPGAPWPGVGAKPESAWQIELFR